MPRRGFTENQRKITFNRPDNPHGVSRCWHCGKRLVYKNRTARDGRGAWHMDHHPIPYVDIEDQMCCGITDERDLSNVVPSCVSCNLSHIFEDEPGKWYYCGRRQNPLGNRKFCIFYFGECSWNRWTIIGCPTISVGCIIILMSLLVYLSHFR